MKFAYCWLSLRWYNYIYQKIYCLVDRLLTHCSLATLYRSGSPLAQLLACCGPHDIIWINADSSFVMLSGIQQRAISQRVPKQLFCIMSLKMILSKLLPYLPGANEIYCFLQTNLLLSKVIINSLWPSDTIWRHKSGSTLAQEMACCLMAPSHYLNQSSLTISPVTLI